MTQEQVATALFALPFLSLALAYGIGLHFLMPRAQPVKVKAKQRRPQ
jgi:hypothetical protein